VKTFVREFHYLHSQLKTTKISDIRGIVWHIDTYMYLQ